MHDLDPGQSITVEQLEENAAAAARAIADRYSMYHPRGTGHGGCLRFVAGAGLPAAMMRVQAYIAVADGAPEFTYAAGVTRCDTPLSRAEFAREITRRGGRVALNR